MNLIRGRTSYALTIAIVTLFKNVKFENHKNVFEYRQYIPDYDSKYVIELKEGEIEKNKIKIGDIITF